MATRRPDGSSHAGSAPLGERAAGRGFVRHLFRTEPGRTAAAIALLVLAGFAEAVGIGTLLPVLEVALGDGGSRLGATIIGLLDLLGLPATLGPLLGLVVAAVWAKAVFRWFAMRHVGYSVARIGAELRRRLVRALAGARWAYFTEVPTGEFAQAVGLDAYRAAFAYRRACMMIAEAIQLAFYLLLALLISWTLVPAALVLGGLVLLLLRGFVRLAKTAGDQQTSAGRAVARRLTDAVLAFKPYKGMARQSALAGKVDREIGRLEAAERRQVLANEALQSVQEPALAAILGLGLYAAVGPGGQSLSAVLVMAFLFYRMAGRLQRIQTEYQQMTGNEGAYWSLDAMAAAAERAAERAARRHAEPASSRGQDSGAGAAADAGVGAASIIFDGVSFRHAGGPSVLREIALAIGAGETVHIAGPSGSGKTTLLDLVLGLREPTSGTIRIDGTPLDSLELAAWRRRIGYVPQETVLLHETIAENVAMADGTVEPAAIERALRAAAAWHFVAELPCGVETVVGERGLKLSGGQRRRLALARALARRPSVLVLDEPTSDVDDATAAAIEASLLRLRGRVTILIASHAPRLAAAADAAYEISGGGLRPLIPSTQ